LTDAVLPAEVVALGGANRPVPAEHGPLVLEPERRGGVCSNESGIDSSRTSAEAGAKAALVAPTL